MITVCRQILSQRCHVHNPPKLDDHSAPNWAIEAKQRSGTICSTHLGTTKVSEVASVAERRPKS
ncbi:hypothetical protein SAMN05660284_02046 [Formivibrio citricus]|uniref:Uncharacterized protein n=1 Tax=Formivibrio citricus TaxID=83765 RepID=A0A1I5B3W8_9NEIS|nr:hypothetical protein SAMN05660284_02046 [Formivibrio citricus]